jgi:hypothetical protein
MDPHSFSIGFITGLMLKWTDLVPIAGGFALCLAFMKIPNITEQIPVFLSNLYEKIGTKNDPQPS